MTPGRSCSPSRNKRLMMQTAHSRLPWSWHTHTLQTSRSKIPGANPAARARTARRVGSHFPFPPAELHLHLVLSFVHVERNITMPRRIQSHHFGAEAQAKLPAYDECVGHIAAPDLPTARPAGRHARQSARPRLAQPIRHRANVFNLCARSKSLRTGRFRLPPMPWGSRTARAVAVPSAHRIPGSAYPPRTLCLRGADAGPNVCPVNNVTGSQGGDRAPPSHPARWRTAARVRPPPHRTPGRTIPPPRHTGTPRASTRGTLATARPSESGACALVLLPTPVTLRRAAEVFLAPAARGYPTSRAHPPRKAAFAYEYCGRSLEFRQLADCFS